MRIDVQTDIAIERPVAEVAAYASNPDNVPQWYVNIKSVEWKSPKPAVVGSEIAFVAQFLGRRLAYTYRIEEWRPGERFVMRTAEGPFPMETTYTWAATTGGATHMTLRNRGTPTGFSTRSWREPSEVPIERTWRPSRRFWNRGRLVATSFAQAFDDGVPPGSWRPGKIVPSAPVRSDPARRPETEPGEVPPHQNFAPVVTRTPRAGGRSASHQRSSPCRQSRRQCGNHPLESAIRDRHP